MMDFKYKKVKVGGGHFVGQLMTPRFRCQWCAGPGGMVLSASVPAGVEWSRPPSHFDLLVVTAAKARP